MCRRVLINNTGDLVFRKVKEGFHIGPLHDPDFGLLNNLPDNRRGYFPFTGRALLLDRSDGVEQIERNRSFEKKRANPKKLFPWGWESIRG